MDVIELFAKFNYDDIAFVLSRPERRNFFHVICVLKFACLSFVVKSNLCIALKSHNLRTILIMLIYLKIMTHLAMSKGLSQVLLFIIHFGYSI